MSKTDPIADYLTCVRNAIMAKHSKVDIPGSNMIKEITRILKEQGYIKDFTVMNNEKQDIVRIYLKYGKDRKNAISGLKRISRPGLRKYTGVKEIPRVLNGLGIAILSTSKGILTDKQAQKEQIGGEVICYVW